ncbi:transposase [Pedobacter vanadiisoli]|uniref:Transposase n=1 Tax=Pedobacter vanadiisoli TaxID=1761975 RepID=A0ABW5MP28_9SPHI
MKYNPLIHNRRSIRLKGYDYSKAGAYFITICCEDRLHRFGKVVDDEMILNESGKIAYNEWINLSDRFSNFELDVFQIMPNHMHGIIVLSSSRATARVAPTIANIIGAYKSIVSNACLQLYKSHNKIMRKLWQRNYYEHIIRNERAYQNISNYIINNPSKWNEDKFYL